MAKGTVSVHFGPYTEIPNAARIVCVPFEIASGTCLIGDKMDSSDAIEFDLEPGKYQLMVAQEILKPETPLPSGEGKLKVTIFIEPSKEEMQKA